MLVVELEGMGVYFAFHSLFLHINTLVVPKGPRMVQLGPQRIQYDHQNIQEGTQIAQ